MNVLVIKQILTCFTLFLVLLCPSVVEALNKQLSEKDKTQIIESILKQETFKESETWRDAAENTVYLLAENISVKQIPRIKGVKFVLIKPEEMEEMKKTGIEYYRFSEFEVIKTGVQVAFIREYVNTTAREANGSVMEYTCRKVAGKWKVKGRLNGVYAS